MNLRKNFRREVLNNGITLLFEKREFPSVAMSITSRIGAAHESEKERGLTHFMEHLLFEGTKKRNSFQIDEEIELGGGELNAVTSNSSVSVYCKISDDFLDRGLDILIDILKNSLFEKTKVEKERKIILEEINMNNDDPGQFSAHRANSSIYSGPISVSILGTKKNLASFKREGLLKRYKEFFSPRNLVFCIVGNCDFSQLKKKIEKGFSVSNFSQPKISKINKKPSRIFKYKKNLDQARLEFSFYSPFPDEKIFYSSHVLYCILNGGASSRFYNKIRTQKGFAYEIDGEMDSTDFYSNTRFSFGCSKKNVLKIERMILEEFKDISLNLKKKELDVAKNKILEEYKLDLESSEEERDNLVESELKGNAENHYDYEKNIRAVKLEDVKKLAAEVKEGNYGLFVLLPKK